MQKISADVAIIGGGIAGLSAALGLSQRKVVVVTKAEFGKGGSTPIAQGGIACAETVIDFCELTRSVRGRRCACFLVDRCRAGDQDFDHAVDVPRILHACADGHISIMTDSCLDIDQVSVQTRDIGFVIGAEVDL